MRFADLVVDPGVEQDPFGGRRLAGIDVRHDADIADLGQVREDVECHCVSSLLKCGCVLAVCRGASAARRRRWASTGRYQR